MKWGAEKINVGTGPIGCNNASPVTETSPIKIVNLSGGASAVDVTLTALKLEA